MENKIPGNDKTEIKIKICNLVSKLLSLEYILQDYFIMMQCIEKVYVYDLFH